VYLYEVHKMNVSATVERILLFQLQKVNKVQTDFHSTGILTLFVE
jgi:hypothetical protein